MNALIEREGWRGDAARARTRQGPGGGMEYHWQLLPTAARSRLLAEAPAASDAAPDPEAARIEAQAYYEALPETGKTKARARLAILQQVEALAGAGLTKAAAVREIAASGAASERTIWGWLAMVEGVDPAEWLFHLPPRNRAGARRGAKIAVDRAFMDRLKADYLRLRAPDFAPCYRRVARICRAEGIAVPPQHLAHRRLKAEVPRVSMVFAREGYAGLARCFPPQVRDRAAMVAMEGVNADCHKIDLFVLWPGEEKPARVQLVGFQDIYSGMILSWRIDHSPNKVMVMAAFGDMVERYGIPRHVLFDNGREFANKWMTGGAKTRFRFKIRDDDPAGVLSLLGCDIHWATPGHGQAKPIERAFRDLAQTITGDPRVAGAYVGNRPDAKPEDYGSRAIPMEELVPIVAEAVEEHNARSGRLSDTAAGRSFRETFEASYAATPVRKATEAQRRLWLMGQERRRLHRDHGRLTLQRNVYWSEWMNAHAGEEVIARFDAEDLHDGAHLYALDGAYLGHAPCEQKVGFFDLTGAQVAARRKAQRRRAEREYLRSIRPIEPAQIAAELAALSADAEAPAPAVEAKVLQMVRPASLDRRPAARRPVTPAETPEEAERHDAFVADFRAARAARADGGEDEALERFRRAVAIERRSEAGERIGEEEARWLIGYRDTPEYRQQRMMLDQFGESVIAP